MNLAKSIFRLLLGQRLPILDGTLEVTGIHQPLTIRRDVYGVPYIEAQTDEDAWYGLGFCHGQDRAFQLESLVRVVRGTLAELVGSDGLVIDRLSRRIGFFRTSQQQLLVMDAETQQWLEAYARGVNGGVNRGATRLAHEFTLLGAHPTPYTAVDMLGVLKMMSFYMAGNWDIELIRLKILTEDGPEALAALDAAYPKWLPVTSPPKAVAGGALDRLMADLAVYKEKLGDGGASNNWVLAPERTATGRPILANDPHLSPSLPCYWYLAHVRTPDWAVAGASFVGGPTFPAGHNDWIAWGLTNGCIDNTDLFIEEIGPDGRSVRQGDSFVPCEVVREEIRVKGGASVEEHVLLTPRGPIVSPALEGDFRALSMSATWMAPRPMRGLLHIHRARSGEEFRACFEQWPALSQNMVFAESSGVIGWQLTGEAPQRRKGWGIIPLPGWDTEVGWEQDPLPFSQMPHLVNPDTGFIVTANAQPLATGEDPFLGIDWIDGYRHARIAEVLDARRDWDIASVQKVQTDQLTILWREVRETVLAVPAQTESTRQGLALLKAWDGRVSADSPAAAVFELLFAEILRRVVSAKAPHTFEWALGKSATPLIARSTLSLRLGGYMSRLVRQQPDGWFEAGWPHELADALTKVIETLRRRYGEQVEQWAWGRVRPLTLQHTVGGRPPLDKVFNLGPFAWGGDATTVGQAAVHLADPTSNSFFVASLRMVIDVGNWDASRYILPGGQSGNPLSPHYADQLPLWQRGEGIPIAWSPVEVEKASHATLRLIQK